MIICPYVKLAPETKKALKAFVPGVEYIFTGTDDLAYWRLLKECWQGKEDLIIVEQDIVIEKTTISRLQNCPRAWCTFAYFLTASFKTNDGSQRNLRTLCPHALGCTKISAEAQRTVPMVDAAPWWELDQDIRFALMAVDGRARSLETLWYPHCHGTVKHLHFP